MVSLFFLSLDIGFASENHENKNFFALKLRFCRCKNHKNTFIFHKSTNICL